MPTDSGGTYSLPAGSTATTGQTILASEHNTPLNDIASALTARLPVDGSKGMSGALKFADGSAASPSLTFGSDSISGIFHKAASTIGFSAAGSEVGSWTTTGFTIAAISVTTIGAADGSAVAPSINFTNEPGTGFYRAGSGIIAAAANGVRIYPLLPTGLIAWFPATVSPNGGWLVCDGGSNLRANYPDLWAYAQASGNLAASEGAKQDGEFGPGDGSTTFTVPNLLGNFIRGWDNGRGVDTGRAIGSFQSDAFASHTHPGGMNSASLGGGAAGSSIGTGPTNTGSAGSGSETRPRNVALLPCIKT